MTMAKGLTQTELSKPVAGLIFLLCWAVAIVAWCFVPHLVGHGLRGFIADVGIIFASIGFAAPFLATKANLGTAFWLGALGVVLFAFSDFFDIQILVYTLRLLAPTLAVLTPVNRFSNTVKIWS
jgi:hypothetical protein